MAPLSDEYVKLLAALPADPAPKKLVLDSHYAVSNENQLWLWHDTLVDRHGVFVGVGCDQNYLMAGWSKPDVLVLMDFDQVVVDVHHVYRSLFMAAKDPAEFMALWKKKKEVHDLLEKDITDKTELKRARSAYDTFGTEVAYRLKVLHDTFKAQKMSTFLDDQTQYQYVVDLYKTNRVFSVRGDLTADLTVKAIGSAAHTMGLPVRVLYLSNAETYWPFGKGYKENVASLPFDEKSIVIRTIGLGSNKNVDPFHYITQDAGNFLLWLKQPWIQGIYKLVKYRRPLEAEHAYTIDSNPDDVGPKAKPSKETKTKKTDASPAQPADKAVAQADESKSKSKPTGTKPADGASAPAH